MPRPPKVIRLDQIESLPGPGTLTWRPVRHALGIGAFGCNAYTADRAGVDVVEPHSEAPDLAHEELYFVATGRATFTIDEQRYDASAGTYVFIPDPSSQRHAVADEPGTTVLSFGGPATFVPSAWEWAFRASALRHSAPDTARGILLDGLEAHPDSASLHYELACVEALAGRPDDAIARLQQGAALKPEVIGWAREDQDFTTLHDDARFRVLLAPD
ncbi:MAG: TPR end-of-group domain-containing protein [Solirubrobacteraceae bacterium]